MLRLIATVVLFAGVMMLAACSEAQPTVQIVPSATPTATAIIAPVVATTEPTDTSLPTPTVSPANTPMLASTSTPFPEPTATSTPEPTATPIPEPTATSTPTPTPTAVPTPTATPSPVLGSRQNPVPFGTTVEVRADNPMDHWELTVVDTIPNAWEVIQAENQFNDPPEPGIQFFIVKIRAKYLGPESNELFLDVSFKALGDSSVVYTGYGCGVIPDELDDLTELFTGGQIEGNDCFEIAASDAASLTMFAEVGLFSSTRVWFSLDRTSREQ